MDNSVGLRVARRFISLPLDKRRLYLEKMLEEGVSPANLPIPETRSGFAAIPLSYAQERQLFLWQMDPHSSAYHIPSVLRLQGSLDIAALERSFNALVQRHESLRTTFEGQGEQWRQVIHPQLPLSIRVESAADAADPQALEARVERFIENAIAQPFDLQNGPLMRVSLLQVAADEQVLVLIQHHIISDGWSISVLIDELSRHYAAERAGQPLQLPALEVQYADYAIWQRHWLEAGERERQLAYWLKTLGSEQTVLELPTDFPRPSVQSQRGARLTLDLPVALGDALRQLAQREGASLFMVLLAAFQALLHRYSGQAQIRVGVPTANRNRVETEGLIGFFVNTQVLSAEVHGQLSFTELLGQVRQAAMQAQAHQDLPFEQLIEALQPERSLSHSPVFQVMYNHQATRDAERQGIQLPGLEIRDVLWEGRTAQFDLTLNTYESASGLAAELTYATDLFKPETIERLARHWQNLLHGVVAAPSARIGELPLLSDAEHRRLLQDWFRAAPHAQPQTCVHQRIAAQAERTPDAVALVVGDVQLSYAELDRRANQLAHRLVEMGVGPDHLVGISVTRSVEMIVGLLAILKAGGAYLPLDPAYPEERLAYMIEDSGIALLLTQEALHGQLPLPDGLATLLLDAAATSLAGYPQTAPPVRVEGEHLAYTLYTSGSTGKPKGVMVRHAALSNFVTSMVEQPGIAVGDRLLSLTTFSFDIFGLEIYGPLQAGACVVLAGQEVNQDPQAVLALVERQAINLLQATPSTWRMLLDHADAARLGGLTFLCGGEALPEELAQRMRALAGALWNLYGPTETTIWSAQHRLDDPQARPYLGTPIDNTALYILGSDLQLNPAGAPGELLIGGAGLARGYFQRPALTAERFVPDPFGQHGERLYRTGDLTRYRAEGVIEYIGRIDHQVKIRGFRIELGEIEARLLALETVREAVVVAHQGAAGAQLVAHVVANVREALDPDAEAALRASLKTHLKSELPDYMVPGHWLFSAQLPLTPNGKVDRKALPAPQVSQQQTVCSAPRTVTEHLVADIWKGVLHLERVGLDDDFFELGGHSLLVSQVMSRLRQALNVQVPLRTLFEHSVLRDFVAALGFEDTDHAPALYGVSRAAPLALSYAQERQWFLWQLDPTSTAYHVPSALRLRGALDLAALQRSFETLIERHESLRTVFVEDQQQVWQVVQSHATLDLQVREVAAGLDAAALQALIGEETRQLFDLRQGPLLRVRLLRLAADEHVLVITLHHIVADGWSMAVMVRELIAAYAAFTQGLAPQLPELAVQYADYAAWQRQWMDAGERERQLDYWVAQLGQGEQPLLELPSDRPRPAEQSYRGARHAIELGADLSCALRQLAQREQVTLFMLLLASFQSLLHRYSGQPQIRVGVPVANRNRVETEGLIGFFVNTQVLKADFDGQQCFADLLQQVKGAVLGAQAHQDLPFEQLVDALQPERSLGHSPLFQVMHNHQSLGREGEAFNQVGAMQVEGLQWPSDTAQFDLTLNTFEGGDSLWAELTYATDLFEAATIERLSQHWLGLLRGVVADSGQRIAELPLLGADERHATLRQWNPAPGSFAGEQCLHRLIEAQAARDPQAVAVVCAGRQLSYAQLNGRANQLAHRLIALGVGPDVRVGLAVERDLELLVGLLAILKAGGAYVPLDPSYPQERLAYMIGDSGIGLLLTQQAVLGDLPVPEGVRSLLLDGQADDVLDGSQDNPDVPMSPDNLAYVIYTSGSTGQPKGTLLAHRNVVRLFEATRSGFDFGPRDVWSLFHSYAFDFSVWEIFGALIHGARLVVVPYEVSRAPQAFFDLLQEQGVTVLNQTPSAFRQLMQVACAPERARLPTALRYVVFGGEALEVKSLRPWFERFGDRAPQLINMYGITETTVHVTYRPLSLADLQGEASSPIGEPIADLSWYLLDSALNPVAKGCIGELYVGRAGLARGYLKRADLTSLRFVPDPFAADGGRLYRTGDLARYRADGVIEYVGRIDHQVKIRGFRIELGEIEAQLLALPAVGQAAVLAQPSPSGQQLVAYLVPADPALLQAEAPQQAQWRDEVRTQLQHSLPEHMVPAHLLLLAQLPLTDNGKLNRRALPTLDEHQAPRVYLAPQSDLEQRLAVIWQDVLKRPQVGLDDNFFELGGDSIISIQVVSRAREAGIRLSPKDLFQHQTVQRLARVAQLVEAAPRIDQQAVTGLAPLLPIQQQFFEDPIVQRHHWNQSVLLEPRQALEVDTLRQALLALVRHHDALRLGFALEHGVWQAEHRELGQGDAQLLWHEPVADASALEALGNRAQRSLDLQHGPLLRAVLADLADGSQRLLLVIHHLVVDGVSWRILLEDLQNAYRQLRDGQPLSLPAKTCAYKTWGEHLQRYARSQAVLAELEYWQACLGQAPAELPCKDPDAGQQNRLAHTVQTRLGADLTRQLLLEAPAAYRTQVNDLLLTALARVIGRWSGQDDTLIQLEGHGREELGSGIDLTRTVGWFTSLFPVRLTAVPDIGESIKRNKEQLRAIPDKGIGFGALRHLGDESVRARLRALPQPRITFNYLGQFDSSFAGEDGALFVPALDNAGVDQSPDAPLGNWLTLNGQVYGGELRVGWTFSTERFEPAAIEALAQAYAEELAALVEHCLVPANHGLTPSDVPLAGLTQARLDSLGLPAGDIADIYPLSPMQQGMLFHTLYEEQGGDYINQMCVDVDGLQVERFRAAWQAAIDAHDVLRSGFVWEEQDARPLQVVHKRLAMHFDDLDWRGRADLPQALAQLETAQREQGFVLHQAPLLRLVVVRVGETCYRLIYTNHHILMDGWSNSQLLGEVLQRYSGLAPRTGSGRYRDYIEWLGRQDAQASKAFWQQQLAAFESPTCLADALACGADQANGSGQGEHYFSLDTEGTRALNRFAQTHKVTANTVVQAAWLLLLQRCTGQDTVAFGATVSGRPAQLPGVEQQIGLFINTLPVIASPRAEQPLHDWLQQVQAQNLALREQEHTPLFDIQRWAGQGGEALFDNILVFENYPVAEALQQGAPQGLRFGEVANVEQTNYPLTLAVVLGEQLSLQFSYDRRQFHGAAVERLAESFADLLHQIAGAANHVRLGDLRLLPGAEPVLQPTSVQALTVTQLFERQVARAPGATALICGEEHVSYAELDARASHLAQVLLAQGCGLETRVGIAVERGVSMIVALLGVLKAGGTYVPLDPEYPAERLAAMVADSGLTLLLTQQHLAAALPAWPGVAPLCLDALPEAAPGHRLPAPVHLQNLAYVMFTSGSTGRPKGVAITQGALSQHAQSMVAFLELTAQDRCLQFATFNFDAFVDQLYPALICGASVVLRGADIWDSETWHRELLAKRFTVSDLTTSYWHMLVKDLAAAGTHDYGALRLMLVGGEAMPPQALSAWAAAGLGHVRLLNTYGPTEATVSATAFDCQQHVNGQRALPTSMPIGQALPGRSALVLDVHGQLAATGVAGELLIGGELLARGYFNRAGLTAERFVPDPFGPAGARLYRTGDLARPGLDDVLAYAGRVDQQLKIRGFRIEPGEIEACLLQVPGVRQALVLAQPSASGPQLAAYVSFDAPQPALQEAAVQTALREQLKAHLKAGLPEYMVPTRLVLLECLPLMPNGKVDRKALPAIQHAEHQGVEQAPLSGIEAQIAEVWQEVLQLPQVGRDDHFFELGGHSLLATQVVARLRKRLDMPLGLRDLFEHPRLRDLAGWLSAQGRETGMAADVPRLQALGVKRQAPLSLVQRRLWVAEQLAGGTAAYGMPLALRLHGELSVPRLVASFAEVVRRHEVLRTAYVQDDEGDPIALIRETVAVDFPLTDLSGVSRSVQQEQVAQAVLDNARTPIDLQCAPLWRGRILRLGASEHVLLFAMHHIISDGWSMGVLVNELVQFYEPQVYAEPAALPVQYSDFAMWQQALERDGVLQQQASYWQNRLDGYTGQLGLPLEKARPTAVSYDGDALQFRLSAQLSGALRSLCARAGVTLYSTLLASFQLLLHRFADNPDIVVGADIAGREQPELEGLIGFFVNVLPLRSRYQARLPFSRFLAQTQGSLLEALEHQDLPLDMIVDTCAVPRHKGMNPLVQVLFVMNNLPVRTRSMGGVSVESLAALETHSKFDMALFVDEEEGQLLGTWQFATTLFGHERIQYLVNGWMALLEQIVADQDIQLGDISMPVDNSAVASRPVNPGPKADKLGKFLKRGASAAVTRPQPVRESLLAAPQVFPLLVEPNEPQLDLIEWIRLNRALLEEKLAVHGGILFRGFALDGIQGFEAFAEAIQPGLYGQYGDLPKKEGGKNTYRSTPYPERKMILFHNESAHQDSWPRKQMFYCEQAAPVGGATPVVDCRLMYERLPAELRDKFESKGLLYVRTFTDRLDVSWQHFFKTEDRAEVEARCRAGGIQWRWLDNDELQTRTPGPAVIRHPVTGAKSFFNQVQLHHTYWLEPDVREDLLAMFGPQRMPRQVYYGDGSPIEDEVMQRIGELYEECAVRFEWQKGDAILLDNMLVAHARDPFEGPRKIVVAMGDMYDRDSLARPVSAQTNTEEAGA